VAGKSEPTRVFELLGRNGQVALPILQLRDEFERGLRSYQSRDWVAAKDAFDACLTHLCHFLTFFRFHRPQTRMGARVHQKCEMLCHNKL
jgi:hypothetical protein